MESLSIGKELVEDTIQGLRDWVVDSVKWVLCETIEELMINPARLVGLAVLDAAAITAAAVSTVMVLH